MRQALQDIRGGGFLYDAVVLMMKGLYTTGRDELRLRSDRRKYSRTQAVLGAAGAVVETLKAD